MLLEIIITFLSASWKFTIVALIFANWKFWVKCLLNKKQSAVRWLLTNVIFTSWNEPKETITIDANDSLEEKTVKQKIKQTKIFFIFISYF